MSDIQVRPAIFAPAPLRRRELRRDPIQWRDVAVFAVGAVIGALFTYAYGSPRARLVTG
jgi:fatty acid desaturase